MPVGAVAQCCVEVKEEETSLGHSLVLTHELDLPLELRAVTCEHPRQEAGTCDPMVQMTQEPGFILSISSPLSNARFLSIGYFSSKQCRHLSAELETQLQNSAVVWICGASQQI